MWSFDPASAAAKAAIDFLLRSYSAPEPVLIQHLKPVDIFSTAPSAVDALLLNGLYVLQDKYTEDRVSTYIGALDGWNEAMYVIRKGQIRWLAKNDVVGQRQFIHALFGIAA